MGAAQIGWSGALKKAGAMRRHEKEKRNIVVSFKQPMKTVRPVPA